MDHDSWSKLRPLSKLPRWRRQLVEENMGLVGYYTKRVAEALKTDPSDLFQEGIFGLMRAALDYERDRVPKVSFSTYAMWWIRHAVVRYINNTRSTVRVPVWACDAIRRDARRTWIAECVDAFGPDSDAGKALLAALPERPAVEFGTAIVRGRTIQTPRRFMKHSEERETNLLDELPDEWNPQSAEDRLDEARVRPAVLRALEVLPERHRAMLRLRFGLDTGKELTLSEIGERYGISRERVRQIEVEALASLRDVLHEFA